MNWLEAQMVFLNAATGTVEFAVNWLLQSTLLIAAGLTAGRLLRWRGAAVQSVIFRTTLAAVLVCPIASWGLSLVGVSGWSVNLPEGWAYQRLEPSPTRATAAVSVPTSGVSEPTTSPTVSAETFPMSGGNAMSPRTSYATPATSAVKIDEADERAPVVVPLPVGHAVEGVPKNTSLFKIRGFGFAALAVSAAWLLVSFLLGGRLVWAWWRLARLRSGSVHADAEIQRDCQEVASLLGVSAPDVLRCPYLPSPCLAGLRRPAVLLPPGELGVSARDALVHELAHLKRRDCHWNLVRQAATTLFFFQPLLWALSRRVERTAEEVCDDYVINCGGDRRGYAHRLVDIAELSSVPITAAGVGIVSLRSVLAKRVSRIMDTSRSLSTAVGGFLLALVLAGGAICTTIVGLVGPHPSLAEAKSLTAENGVTSHDERGSTESGRKAAAANEDVITVRGSVVDPDGKPVAGAAVHVLRWYWDPAVPKVSLAAATSDSRGRFEISYRKSQFTVDVGRPEMWKEVTIIASAKGFGPGWVERDKLPPGAEPTLHLVRDDVPITGRAVDLEGRPLSDVTITMGNLAASPSEKLDDWLAALRRGEIFRQAGNRYLGRYTPPMPRDIADTLQTKPDGSF